MNFPSQRIRSYALRQSRMTLGQKKAYAALWPQIGLNLGPEPFDLDNLFGKKAPCYLEIGFGSGHSLLALAKDNPHCHYIGVETHKPGIGALLIGVERLGLKNIRLFQADVVDVLLQAIGLESLSGIQVFFPDPWPKRRHHPRRLIQPDFVDQALSRLKPTGTLHLATDWEDYAMHMLKVLSAHSQLQNLAGDKAFASRSPYRPILTKFESRAIKEARSIWELQFTKLSCKIDAFS